MDKRSEREGRRVSKAALAEIFGVSLPTVDEWVRRGCPVIQRGGRGREWTFDTAALARWLRDKAAEEAAGDAPADIDELKRRKLAAETGIAELEFLKARGDVAPMADFERAQARVYAVIRTNIMHVPQRVVTQLLGEQDEARFKSVLIAELRLALETAAEADIDDGEAEIDDVDGE